MRGTASLKNGTWKPLNKIQKQCSRDGIPYENLLSNTSGIIVLSTVGNVSENITGTFDAEVVSLLASNTTDTLRITGSFRTTRVYYNYQYGLRHFCGFPVYNGLKITGTHRLNIYR